MYAPHVPRFMILVHMFPHVPQSQCYSEMFPSPVAPQTYITQSLCSPVLMFPIFPSPYVSSLCSPVPVLPSLDWKHFRGALGLGNKGIGEHSDWGTSLGNIGNGEQKDWGTYGLGNIFGEHREWKHWGTSLGKIGTGNSYGEDWVWGTKCLGGHSYCGISVGKIGAGSHLWGISSLGRGWRTKGLGSKGTGKHRDWET